jgi:polyhydroxyalkanoate synthesis regulator phasin
MAKKEIKGKCYNVTGKGVCKSIEKAFKRGYDEFKDLIEGKMTFEEFVKFVDGMGMSEVENAGEAKTANILHDAVTDLNHYLRHTEQITQEEHDALENAVLEIPYDDSI